jgi:hypothetical protein
MTWTRVVALTSGAVIGALPIAMLLFVRTTDSSRLPALLAAFVLAALSTVRADRAPAWWATGAMIGLLAALNTAGASWHDWRLAIYVVLIPAVIVPVLAGAATGLIAGAFFHGESGSRRVRPL